MNQEQPKMIDANRLPAPRLELRWHRQNDQEWQWIVDYNLVLLLAPYDIRHTKKNEFSGKCHEKQVRLGRTKVGTEKTPDKYGRIETPFRDGVHIMHDAIQLRLPLYAVWDDKATVLEPLPIGRYEERMKAKK